MLRSDRRRFVVRVAKGFLVYAFGLLVPRRTAAAPSSFTARQYSTLEAATERIFPRDRDPGANDLNAHRYIDRALSNPDLAVLRSWIVSLLDGLEADATRLHRRSFTALDGASADAILTAWQKSGDAPRRAAFGLLHTLTLEGVFCDPQHGGNRDGRGYALVGYRPSSRTGCR